MKIAILMSLFVSIASVSQAGDRPFADFKNIVGDETIVGTENSETTCEVKYLWLSSGDLEVTAVTRHKKKKPKSHTVVFSTSKGAEYFINHRADDNSEYTITQSKSLIASAAETVDLIQSLTINQDASQTTHVNFSVMEVNDHSDPSEIFTLFCQPN